jgi:hypothetical protein
MFPTSISYYTFSGLEKCKNENKKHPGERRPEIDQGQHCNTITQGQEETIPKTYFFPKHVFSM